MMPNISYINKTGLTFGALQSTVDGDMSAAKSAKSNVALACKS